MRVTLDLAQYFATQIASHAVKFKRIKDKLQLQFLAKPYSTYLDLDNGFTINDYFL